MVARAGLGVLFIALVFVAWPAGGPVAAEAAGPILQPGSEIHTAAVSCTAGFLLVDFADRVHMATAGHCFQGVIGEDVWLTPPLGEGVGPHVGTLEFFAGKDNVDDDFALVAVDQGFAVDPAVRGWTAPRSIADCPTHAAGEAVRFAGNTAPSAVYVNRAVVAGQPVGGQEIQTWTLPTGTGQGILATASARSYTFRGLWLPGMSGGPSLGPADEALGINTYVIARTDVQAGYGNAAGICLSYALDLAAHSGFNLNLLR